MRFRHNSIVRFWNSPDGPGVTAPPTALFVAAFAAAYLIQPDWAILTSWENANAIVWCGGAIALAGVALFLWAMWTFARSRTGIMLQAAATQVVIAGPYRWSRNPMYVSFIAVYVGIALITRSAWPLVWLPLAVAGTQKWVISREERYLRTVFPIEYSAYCRQVRRWI